MFVLDASGSIHPDDFQRQLLFVNDIVGTFRISRESVRIGVITFGTSVTGNVRLHNNQIITNLQPAILRINQRGGVTNTHLALRFLRNTYFGTHNSRSNAIKIGIVITDGISQNTTATLVEAGLTRAAGIMLFAIGVGNYVNEDEVEGIANEPAEEYTYTVENYSDLQQIKARLTRQTCAGITMCL